MTDLAIAKQVAHMIVMDTTTGVVTFNHGGADPLVVRARIAKLAKDMHALPGEKMDLQVEHEFVDGMYVRRLFIPKGTLLVGKVHRQPCVNVCEKGDISILTETGSRRVTAGFTGISQIGIQKVGYANEDTVFTNIFRTDEQDIEKLESEIACETREEFEQLASVPDALVIEGA